MSQKFDSKVLDLLKQKIFYPYDVHMYDFEKFKQRLPSKEKFCCSLANKKLLVMNMKMFLKFKIHFK